MTIKIEQAAKIAFKNRKLLADYKEVGCYYCLSIFKPEEIVAYTDKDETAICPRCNIDSVIPTTDEKILKTCHEYWFVK
jgi:hypothetical protein